SRAMRFDGYVDEAATRSKIRSDVFARGDRWFDTGDLVTVHRGGWLSFADRVGDTFRWKGENVSTLEVATVIGRAPGVTDASVYGVRIPGCEGRACMGALATDGEADLDALAAWFEQHLAPYQRPLFVRLLAAPMRTTSTFKQQTASYREEGYDPARVTDPLYVSVGGRFREYGAAQHAALERGEIVPS
ncbi:MAG TPA: long-chain-acyl-CoA synthetase, partial [Alphaproteobacteria bacterium]|nr:long-chain-acyl-CoA synthetase [Alphaproteobacteria bacterium]